MMFHRFAFVAFFIPLALPAQYLPARVVRHGGGIEVAAAEPVSFFIEHSREIELTDAQKDTMMAIRRRLRNQNAPYLRQLDSLRNVLGIDFEPRGKLSDKDRDKFERFQNASAPFADSIRVNNDAARGEAWSLLEDAQRAKVDSIVKEDRERKGRERRPPRTPGN